jgi:uncharacterized protein YggE
MRLHFLLVAILPMSLSAQITARDSVVTISASRTSKIAPDRASFYVTVEGTAETPNDAVARVETKLRAVTDALKGLGSRVTLDAPIAYGVGPSPAPNGYPGNATPPTNLARSVIRVQVNRPDQIANVIATAIAAGASGSSSLSFESSLADSVRRARIAEALSVARTDAEATASSLGLRLGALVSVSSTASPIAFGGSTQIIFDNRYSSQSSPAPEITIVTNVTVQYRLVR